MARSWAWTWGLALALSWPLSAQDARSAVAVLPFENTGSYGQDKENFEALQLGIPAMLASDLANAPGVRVIDRERIREALRQQGLEPAQRIDAATATQLAGGVGARYVVSGSFADYYGKFRINARVVDAQTGRILTVVSNDDPKLQDRAQLSASIHAIAGKVTAALALPGAKTPPPSRSAAVPTDAITQFGRGLLYESQGDRVKAGEAFQQALAAFTDYPEARAALQRVRGP